MGQGLRRSADNANSGTRVSACRMQAASSWLMLTALSLLLAGCAPAAGQAGQPSHSSRNRPAMEWVEAAAKCDTAWMEALGPGVLVAFGDDAKPAAGLCGEGRLARPAGWVHTPNVSTGCSETWGFCLTFFVYGGVIKFIRAESLPPDGAGPGPVS